MTLRRTLCSALLTLGIAGASQTAWAHHSLASQFSTKKPVTLRGSVTGLVWVNPHGRILVDVKTEDGKIEKWTVETGATGRMIRRGLRKTDFAVGTEVIVTGYAAIDDAKHAAAGMVVTFPNREVKKQEATFSLGR